MDLLKPGNPRRVMLGMCLQMWSQLCGMNIMMYDLLEVMLVMIDRLINILEIQVLHCLRLRRRRFDGASY